MITIEKNNNIKDVGIDLTYISIFENNLDNLLNKILTSNEKKECYLKDKNYRAKYVAGRWALKEAIWKACNKYLKIESLLQIEILNDKSGKPHCTNIKDIKISLSYCKNQVIAICIFVGKSNI